MCSGFGRGKVHPKKIAQKCTWARVRTLRAWRERIEKVTEQEEKNFFEKPSSLVVNVQSFVCS